MRNVVAVVVALRQHHIRVRGIEHASIVVKQEKKTRFRKINTVTCRTQTTTLEYAQRT